MEEWNEFGELKENIGPVPANNAAPAGSQVGVNIAPPLSVNPTATGGTTNVTAPPVGNAPPETQKSRGIPLPGAEEIAARNQAASPSTLDALNPETLTSSPQDKKDSIEKAKEVSKHHPSLDHLSAPASRIQSGTATPAQTEQEQEPAPDSKQHRGSDVVQASAEEIMQVESKNALKEEEGETDAATKGVEDMKVGDGGLPQEQAAKEPALAATSVED